MDAMDAMIPCLQNLAHGRGQKRSAPTPKKDMARVRARDKLFQRHLQDVQNGQMQVSEEQNMS